MKLYLSSYRIPDLKVLTDLIGKPADKIRVALIPNAKDYYAPRAKKIKTRAMEEYLRGLGFRVAVVDLNDQRSLAELEELLRSFDLIWARGGNTFCLREAMHRSGFDAVIKSVLSTGVVFGGDSAGACVAGTDLHGVELCDEAEFAEKVIWKALHLSDHYFVPHVENADIGDIIEQIIDTRPDDPTMVQLTDSQAWIVNGDDEWKITGPKPHIVD